MAFEFGMFHEFQRPAGMTEEEAFATSFEEIDAAERWGLDAMWLAEIHVEPERSVCSAPLTLASAIAARTKRMKIGTGVQVLPLCHPLRLAEEAATVDQISHGRLIFGIGRSGFPRTYEAYGVPYGESRERFAETLEILKRAWTEPKILVPGQVLQLRQCRADAEAVSKAVAGDPHRRQQRRYLSADRQARPRRLRRGAPGIARGAGAKYRRLSQGVEGGRASRRRQGVFARAGLCRRDRRGGDATSRKKASCISTAISASGWRIRRPAPACERSRIAGRARAAIADDHL